MELKYKIVETISSDVVSGSTGEGVIVGGTINIYQLETGQEWSVRVGCSMKTDGVCCSTRRGEEGITCGADNKKADGSPYYMHIYCAKSRRIIQLDLKL